jgi:ATP-binding protein involved in chromosome partitioning
MAVTQLSEETVLQALGAVQDPELHRPMMELKMIQDVAVIDPQTIAMRVVLTTPACPLKNKIHDDIDAALATLPGSPKAEIKWDSMVSRTGGVPQKQQVQGVKNIISVGAGKGGVGKSTCAVNIALALSQLGARTAVLDADVYGPNVPILLGAEHEKPYAEEEKIIPIQRYGIKMISLGFFIEADKPAIWRGPMLSGAVRQFLFDVNWGELDYLVVDLPPGTGDVQLTMSQSIPMTGAVVVSTPQDVSTADVGRAIQMFNTLKVPNLGLVENMSYFICPHCGEREDIFGHGGAKTLAERMHIPFLGEIPLDRRIREGGGPGVPLMVHEPDSPLAAVYRDVASHLAAQVSIRNFKQASVIPLRTI